MRSSQYPVKSDPLASEKFWDFVWLEIKDLALISDWLGCLCPLGVFLNSHSDRRWWKRMLAGFLVTWGLTIHWVHKPQWNYWGFKPSRLSWLKVFLSYSLQRRWGGTGKRCKGRNGGNKNLSTSRSSGWWKETRRCVQGEGLKGKQANLCQAEQRFELKFLFLNSDFL